MTSTQINSSNKQKHHFNRRFEFCTGLVRSLTWIQLNFCEVMRWQRTGEDFKKSRFSMLSKNRGAKYCQSRYIMLILYFCLKRLSTGTESCAVYFEKTQSGFPERFQIDAVYRNRFTGVSVPFMFEHDAGIIFCMIFVIVVVL